MLLYMYGVYVRVYMHCVWCLYVFVYINMCVCMVHICVIMGMFCIYTCVCV